MTVHPTGLLTIDSATYHADQLADRPSLSASLAKILIGQSPAHAKAAHPRLNPNFQRVEEDKFSVGTAAHALLLEGEAGVAVIPYDDWRTNAAKEGRDIARQHGKTPLLAKEWDQVQAMCAATRAQLDAIDADPALFVNGKAEQTIAWEENGVLCRSRLDWLHDDLSAIDDYKSAGKPGAKGGAAHPDKWIRSTLFAIGADVQAEFYSRGVEILTGVRPDFRFVVQEPTAPYALSVIALGPDVMALAKKKVDFALDLWARCLRNDAWPAYPTQVCWAELPGWEENRWLEKEMREIAA